MLEKTVLDGKEEMLSYSYDLFHMSSEKTKRIYQEENKEMMKFLIETYVGYLKKTTHGKKAYSIHINLEIILIVVIIMILSYRDRQFV